MEVVLDEAGRAEMRVIAVAARQEREENEQIEGGSNELAHPIGSSDSHRRCWTDREASIGIGRWHLGCGPLRSVYRLGCPVCYAIAMDGQKKPVVARQSIAESA